MRLVTTAFVVSKGHKILHEANNDFCLSIIPEFQEKIDIMNLNSRFDVNKAEITNKESGSEIIEVLKSSSGDQTANLNLYKG
jgi:hypothetical protein